MTHPLSGTMRCPKASTIRAIYKCLLQDARALRRTPQFRLRNALRLEQWGSGHYVPPLGQSHRGQPDDQLVQFRTLEEFMAAKTRGFRPDEPVEDVEEMIRRSFKEKMHLRDPKAIASALDDAIAALHEISEQLILADCSSVTVTNGIRIEATSQFVPTHSNPELNLYRFTYRITITNESMSSAFIWELKVPLDSQLLLPDELETVQITGRQYTFESERGQRIALPRNSPGIVGNTPVLQPGQTFEYASGVDIDSPRGFVTGCLHVVRRDKDSSSDAMDSFDAYVSKFSLRASPQ
ncbi:hypothetical protein ATCC90586_006752 [Pythium insidiosum]|nr:hypothetical protein ATCC90586_006752 [Pythium insidiosum]